MDNTTAGSFWSGELVDLVELCIFPYQEVFGMFLSCCAIGVCFFAKDGHLFPPEPGIRCMLPKKA